MYQSMTPFASYFLYTNLLIFLMVVNRRTEAHNMHPIAFSIFAKKKKKSHKEAHSQPKKIPIMNSSNKNVTYFETKHYYTRLPKLQGMVFRLSECIYRQCFGIRDDNLISTPISSS